jgi:hypothetical protein
MNSTSTQSRIEEAPRSEPKLEFIKIDDGRLLVRVTRGNSVTEAIVHTVPPETHEPDETQLDVPTVAQDAP